MVENASNNRMPGVCRKGKQDNPRISAVHRLMSDRLVAMESLMPLTKPHVCLEKCFFSSGFNGQSVQCRQKHHSLSN